MKKENKISKTILYWAHNISILVGLILVGRGAWYVLDGLDELMFGGSSLWTGLGGVVLGLFILYIPDKNLKEIENL
jgi:hypothetical protein